MTSRWGTSRGTIRVPQLLASCLVFGRAAAAYRCAETDPGDLQPHHGAETTTDEDVGWSTTVSTTGSTCLRLFGTDASGSPAPSLSDRPRARSRYAVHPRLAHPSSEASPQTIGYANCLEKRDPDRIQTPGPHRLLSRAGPAASFVPATSTSGRPAGRSARATTIAIRIPGPRDAHQYGDLSPPPQPPSLYSVSAAESASLARTPLSRPAGMVATVNGSRPLRSIPRTRALGVEPHLASDVAPSSKTVGFTRMMPTGDDDLPHVAAGARA